MVEQVRGLLCDTHAGRDRRQRPGFRVRVARVFESRGHESSRFHRDRVGTALQDATDRAHIAQAPPASRKRRQRTPLTVRPLSACRHGMVRLVSTGCLQCCGERESALVQSAADDAARRATLANATSQPKSCSANTALNTERPTAQVAVHMGERFGRFERRAPGVSGMSRARSSHGRSRNDCRFRATSRR